MKLAISRLMKPRACFLALVAGWSFSAVAFAADELTIKVDQPGAKIGPMFFGLMTEEINHAYDGGLYAELIQNRILKDGIWKGGRRHDAPDPKNPPHWTIVKSGGADGDISLDNENPVNKTALTTSLRLDMKGGGGKIGVANEGFWGIPVKPNTQYKASLYARGSDDFKGPLTLAIESNDGATQFATATIPEITKEWKKYTATLKTGEVKETADAQYVISSAGDKTGSAWLNLVSLFPPTYKDQPNGFRIDIMEKLAELQPTFLRFPGGNYLEGPDHENRFNWKTTIGPLEERPGHECPWQYRSSDGLGLMEFLMWCEDLKMEPVLAVYAGLHIGGGRDVITGDALKPHVQDALDEIEYVTGDTSTTWGARRAKDGHPAPFKLTYVEVGNEDNLSGGLASYNGRFTMFYDAIKEKYPNLQIISTVPPNRRQPNLHNLARKPDLIDDHNYSPAVQSMRLANRHDGQEFRAPDAPKIFMGEWASNGAGQGSPTPNLRSALGDAAFLGGLERNADVVVMQCYAPLLVNVNRPDPKWGTSARQWSTNLIGYDALQAFGSASFYGQKMYSNNRGDRVLPVEVKVARLDEVPAAPEPQPQPSAQLPLAKGRVGVGTWQTRSEFKDMKVTVGDKVVYSVDPATVSKDWMFGEGQWKWDGEVLRQSSDDPNCRAVVGDPSWTDFIYTLKARKLSGDEGFLILLHARDDGNWIWWNVGGWGNTYTAIQRTEGGVDVGQLGRQQQVIVEPNRWYDVKIETEGHQIRCYLDGQLVAERSDLPGQQQRGQAQQGPPAPMYASAVRDEKTGDVILRAINSEATPHTVTLNLQGVKNVAKDALVEVISGQPMDVNTVSSPTNIAPKKSVIDNAAASFTHEFPPYSLSVIRLTVQ